MKLCCGDEVKPVITFLSLPIGTVFKGKRHTDSPSAIFMKVSWEGGGICCFDLQRSCGFSGVGSMTIEEVYPDATLKCKG